MVGNDLPAPGSVPPSTLAPSLKKEPQTLSPLHPLPLSTIQNCVEWIFGKNTNSPTLCFYATVGFPFLALVFTPEKL